MGYVRNLQTRIVKRPRKAHECDLCGDPITGEHVYTAFSDGGLFGSSRRHVRCQEIVAAHCNACPYTLDCQGDPDECVIEALRRAKHTSDDLRYDLRAIRDDEPLETADEYIGRIERENTGSRR